MINKSKTEGFNLTGIDELIREAVRIKNLPDIDELKHQMDNLKIHIDDRLKITVSNEPYNKESIKVINIAEETANIIKNANF